ncbi:MAG: efflux RND transporter periplasmic adaptor subunit [Calditrichaceae bacterium]
MKNKKLYVTAAVIIILIALFGILSGQFGSGDDNDISDLKTSTVSRRDIGSTVLATGIIKPMVGAEVRVGSRVSGIVQNLHANIGDEVTKGQLIAQLDPTELQAKYNQANAALDNAKATFEYARVDLKRQKSLLDQKFISQNQYDLAEKAFEINKSLLEQAEANLDFAKVQLEYTRITAPISGVIASVSTQEGETVAASFNSPTFVTIINLDRLEVWTYVDETDIGRIHVGQKGMFSVDTYSDTDFEGTVTAIYPKAEIQDNVVNYISTVKINDNKEKILRPEMTTNVTIFLETRENVLTVPNAAVHRERGKKYVNVLEKNLPVKRYVTVGWKSGSYTEITEGLSENEKVIVGNFTIKN